MVLFTILSMSSHSDFHGLAGIRRFERDVIMVPPIFAGEEDKGPLEFVRFVFEKVKGKKRPQRPRRLVKD